MQPQEIPKALQPPAGFVSKVWPVGLFGITLILLAWSGCRSVHIEHRADFSPEQAREIPGGRMAAALIRSTLGATARAPIESTWSGAVMLRDRTHALIHGLVPGKGLNEDKAEALPAQAGGSEFEAYLDEAGFPAMTSGSVEILVDGKEFFPELLKEIDAAVARVDIQTYIFDNDPFAIRIADVLKKKSSTARIRVYMDALGSEMAGAKAPPALENNPPEGPVMHRYLEAGSKVRVRRFWNPWLVSDHIKLHLIDDHIAYVGGMNVGWEYFQGSHDMMVRVEGPVVHTLADVFESHWRDVDWTRNWGLKWTSPPAKIPLPVTRDTSRDIPLRILMTQAKKGRREILDATSIAIRSASRRVWIHSPYFTSDHITMEMENALRRGVDVRVLIPGGKEAAFMDTINAASLEKFAKAGGKIYAYPGITHLKAAVIDDWAIFGSANHDTLSMRINRELNLASSHPKLVEGLVQRVFLPDFRKSRRMTTKELGRISSGPAGKVAGDQL